MSCMSRFIDRIGIPAAVFLTNRVAYTKPVNTFEITGGNRPWPRFYIVITILTGLLLSQLVFAGELVPFPQPPETPPLELLDLSGQQHNINDYEGKVILVNFWASWCQPCLREMPSMQRLHKEMQGRPLSILAVNVEESKSKVWRFKKLLDVSFTTLLDSKGEVARAWDIQIYPTSYLIDGEGQVRYGAQGALEWDSEKVKQLIETLMSKQEAPVQAALD